MFVHVHFILAIHSSVNIRTCTPEADHGNTSGKRMKTYAEGHRQQAGTVASAGDRGVRTSWDYSLREGGHNGPYDTGRYPAGKTSRGCTRTSGAQPLDVPGRLFRAGSRYVAKANGSNLRSSQDDRKGLLSSRYERPAQRLRSNRAGSRPSRPERSDDGPPPVPEPDEGTAVRRDS